MGIKERRTKILFSLVLLSDVDFKPVEFDEKAQKAFDLTFNQKTRGSLSGLIREGLLEKVDKSIAVSPLPAQPKAALIDGTNTYRITLNGFYELCLKFPFFRFLRDKWDGKWRVLSYEIPEKKRELRDKLRREVAGWGLGPWHRSFWLTPHPIIENLRTLLAQKEEEQYVQAFESQHVFGNSEVLIEKVWLKSLLEKKYKDLFKKWHEILSKQAENTQKFKEVIDEYVSILRTDPGLPKDLVGESWIGIEAFNIFKEIRTILLG